MAFKLKNSNLFLVPNNPHMLHVATIEDGFREYIAMLCISGLHKGKFYIEEVVLNTVDYSSDVFANCKFIEDDQLANDLAAFLEEKGLSDMKRITDTLIDTQRSHWLIK